jgi:hypothetical protein
LGNSPPCGSRIFKGVRYGASFVPSGGRISREGIGAKEPQKHLTKKRTLLFYSFF